MLDAAKRKNLPAWIREGLEKMEREKQKKEERERFLQERELRRQNRLQEQMASGLPARSRFDDDSDEEDGDDEDERHEVRGEGVNQPERQHNDDDEEEEEEEPARPSFSLQSSSVSKQGSFQDIVRVPIILFCSRCW